MATSTTEIKEKNQEYQRDRAIERARIAALYEMKNKADHSVRQKLFELSDLEEGWKDFMPAAVAGGLLYARHTGGDDDFIIRLDQFIAFKASQDPSFEPDFKNPTLQQEFLDFLYEQELKTYITKHETIQQQKQKTTAPEMTHLQFYKDMLKMNALKGGEADKFKTDNKMDARIKDHQNAEKIRELSSRARFMQKHGILPTEEFKKQGENYGYKNWDGVQSLPDVNLKKKSETQAVINMSDLGVNLTELYNIMNQKGEKGSLIDYPNLPCDKGPNPFREIMFEHTSGVPPITNQYTLMAWIEKDKNGKNAFMVKPCLVSAMRDGNPKPVEINDWLNIAVDGPKDPAGMSVAEAQADAMLKLARFSFRQMQVLKDVGWVSEPEGGQVAVPEEVRDVVAVNNPDIVDEAPEFAEQRAAAGTAIPIKTAEVSKAEAEFEVDVATESEAAEAEFIKPGQTGRNAASNLQTTPAPKPGVATEGEVILSQGEIAGVSGEAEQLESIGPGQQADQAVFAVPDEGETTPLDAINLAGESVDLTASLETSQESKAVFVDQPDPQAQKARLVKVEKPEETVEAKLPKTSSPPKTDQLTDPELSLLAQLLRESKEDIKGVFARTDIPVKLYYLPIVSNALGRGQQPDGKLPANSPYPDTKVLAAVLHEKFMVNDKAGKPTTAVNMIRQALVHYKHDLDQVATAEPAEPAEATEINNDPVTQAKARKAVEVDVEGNVVGLEEAKDVEVPQPKRADVIDEDVLFPELKEEAVEAAVDQPSMETAEELEINNDPVTRENARKAVEVDVEGNVVGLEEAKDVEELASLEIKPAKRAEFVELEEDVKPIQEQTSIATSIYIYALSKKENRTDEEQKSLDKNTSEEIQTNNDWVEEHLNDALAGENLESIVAEMDEKELPVIMKELRVVSQKAYDNGKDNQHINSVLVAVQARVQPESVVNEIQDEQSQEPTLELEEDDDWDVEVGEDDSVNQELAQALQDYKASKNSRVGVTSRDDLNAEIRAGKKLKGAVPVEKEQDPRGALLAGIEKGVKLNKVGEKPETKPNENKKQTVFGGSDKAEAAIEAMLQKVKDNQQKQDNEPSSWDDEPKDKPFKPG